MAMKVIRETFLPRMIPVIRAPRTSHRLSTVLSPRVENAPLADNTKLSNVKFSVFGLGSRAFPNFCTFAHSIDKMFEELGGDRFHPCGEGDELCGQEESFRSWCKSAYQEACKKFGVDPNLKTEDTDKMLASGKAHSYEKGRFRAKPWDKSPVEHNVCIALSKVHKKPAYSAVLKNRKNLQSKESNRSTILCVLESDLSYSPGDHLAIYPENETSMVNTILKRLNPDPGPDEPIVVEYRSDTKDGGEDWEQETRLPVPLTLRQALTHYLDITSPPTPQFLSLLAKQTNRPTDREALNKLADGGAEYEDWKYSCFPNLLDVIEQFPSLQKMDICLLLTGLPLLQTRYYSISSSPLKHLNEIHITVAVVSFMKKVLTDDGRGLMHHGVCSTWLNTIPIGATVPCSIRVARNFHMPDDPKTPMVLIGPGTGIAPFRSFWQEREYQLECLKTATTPGLPIDPEESFAKATAKKEVRLNAPGADDTDNMQIHRSVSDAKDLRALARKAAKMKDRDFGKAIIYFGCRNSRMDHIYKEELEKCKMAGALDEVYVAFSRDKEVMEKTYVQDLLKKNANEIIELLMESQAHFYVCGDISMASDVYRTLENIMADNAAMSSSEAREFMDKIKESGRYHEDIFGVTLRTAEVTQQKRTAAKRAWTILFSAMDGSAQDFTGGLQSQDQTDGRPSAIANVQANMGARRLSLVRRPTVTVLINQQAGTPTTPGTPKLQTWSMPMRRKPSEPMMTNREKLEIPAHHALNTLPDAPTRNRAPPSSLIEAVRET